MEHIYQHVQGWFGFPNLYSSMVKNAKNNSHFVEVGAWLGKSALYMAVEIMNSGKNIRFDCVDTWEGSEEHKNMHIVKDKQLYNQFLKNIEPVKTIINPIKLPSLEATKTYLDNSLDFVFIDASHDYENVKNDIWAWYPKVKVGGVLCGHDFNDWPGVRGAVFEFLDKNKYDLSINSEECWGIIKK